MSVPVQLCRPRLQVLRAAVTALGVDSIGLGVALPTASDDEVGGVMLDGVAGVEDAVVRAPVRLVAAHVAAVHPPIRPSIGDHSLIGFSGRRVCCDLMDTDRATAMLYILLLCMYMTVLW